MVEEGAAAAAAGNVVNEFVAFLNASPTPFHAVYEAKNILQAAGFVQLSEREDWSLVKGGKYFFTRNYSTIVAFAVGKLYVPGNGFGIIGAHTDSPCPKLKPVSKVTKGGFLEVGVQTYGGGLWHTWFDRDLSVAGQVIVRQGADESSTLLHKLVRIRYPIMRIPTLAIHLDRTVSDGFKFNTQTHLVPILATAIKAEVSKQTCAEKPNILSEADGVDENCKPLKANCGAFETASGGRTDEYHHSLFLKVLARELRCLPEEIYDFELNLCDTQPSMIGGALQEFIFSGRLDNLCMSFCALKALVDATTEDTLGHEDGVQMVALFDHEEVGSNSAQGAGSPALFDALTRITLTFSTTQNSSQIVVNRTIQNSILVSADMAHALHPNYPEKHEDNHQVKMHKGLVIKHNANQRYATNAVTATIFRHIGQKHNLPVQDFVVRNDMACGSTIGPILASGVGIRTVDVGAPQLSMHSIREMCAVDDVGYSYEHFKAFFREFSRVDAKLSVDS